MRRFAPDVVDAPPRTFRHGGSSLRAAWAAAGLGLATGCGTPTGGTVSVAPTSPALTSPQANDVPAASPHWRVHPPGLGSVHDGVPLLGDRWLLIDDRGRRWVARAHPTAPRRYLATASSDQAPAALASVAPAPNGTGWWLLDVNGDLYRAATPLGPAQSAPRPPEQLVALDAAGDSVIGTTLSGSLLRADNAGGWSAVAPGTRVFDVAIGADGAALGLALPEALIESQDGGRHWRGVVDWPTVGARSLAPASDGGVVVQGVHRVVHWAGFGARPTPGAAHRARQIPGQSSDEPTIVAAAPGPSAAALAEGNAVLSGARYYAAIEAETVPSLAAVQGGTSRWLWARGTLGSELEVGPLPVAERCESVHLAAASERVLLGCVRFDDTGERAEVELQLSTDGGSHWSPRAVLQTPGTSMVALALGPEHMALVSGACLPSEEECEPRAPLRLVMNAQSAPLATHAAELVDTARFPVFSPDGSTAYFTGRRAKDGHMALFVSQDGARSFAAVPIEPPRSSPRAPAANDDGLAAMWELSVHDGPSPPRPSLGPEGQLGLVFDTDAPLYALCDEAGRIRHVVRLPAGTLAVSGAGASILALVARETPDEGEATVEIWESTSAGRTFRKVDHAPRLSLEELEATGGEVARSLRCSEAGCVVGALASRLGWGPGDGAVETPSPLRAAPRPEEPAVVGPLQCTVDEEADWQTIHQVHSDAGTVLPTASQLMRGPYAWTVLRYADSTGEATVVGAMADSQSAAVVERPLLRAVQHRAAYAVDVAHQAEGYLVARVPLPPKGVAAGVPMTEATVAWLDAFDDVRREVTLPAPGSFSARSVTPGPRPGLYGTLLSVARAGALVDVDRSEPDVWLLGTGSQPPQALQYPQWPAVTGGLRLMEDALVVDGRPMALGWLFDEDRQTAAIGLAPLDGLAADPVFVAISPTQHRDREVVASLGYQGDTIGIVLHVAERGRPAAWASFSPIASGGQLGAAVPLPTQASLGESPVACSAQQRRESPRQVAPRLAGRRHPVLVQSATGLQLLLTDAAVLHGTPEAPCVAAWTAVGLPPTANGLVAVLSGDPSRAWLFRATPTERDALDVRPMSCRPWPEAPLPSELWTADATHVRR